LEDLQKLAAKRDGSAQLKSISPYKFNLQITAKTPQDIYVDGELCKRITKGEQGLASSRVVFEVKIELKHLPRLLNDFIFLLPKKRLVK
jgi:hypothetical protein